MWIAICFMRRFRIPQDGTVYCSLRWYCLLILRSLQSSSRCSLLCKCERLIILSLLPWLKRVFIYIYVYVRKHILNSGLRIAWRHFDFRAVFYPYISMISAFQKISGQQSVEPLQTSNNRSLGHCLCNEATADLQEGIFYVPALLGVKNVLCHLPPFFVCPCYCMYSF